MKTYLLTWNAGQVEVMQKDILDYLDTMPTIQNWHTPFLGAVLIVAEDTQSAHSLATSIHPRFPSLLFAIAPVEPLTSNGWTTQVFWDLVTNPKSSGRWPNRYGEMLNAYLSGKK